MAKLEIYDLNKSSFTLSKELTKKNSEKGIIKFSGFHKVLNKNGLL